MWSHVVTSDVNAVMEALARQNKEVELGFRASRMERLMREQEAARIREIQAARAREAGGVIEAPSQPAVVVPTGEGEDAPREAEAPGTPRDKPGNSTGTGTSTPAASGAPAPAGPPVFGAVKERPPSTTTKKSSKKGKEVSAETAHKMSNMTAMRATGSKLGKYSWLNNAPNVSSPLAGRKKKGVAGSGAEGEEGGDGAEEEGGERKRKSSGAQEEAPAQGGAGIGHGPRKKSKLSQSTSAADPSTPAKKPRPKISVPARRLVPVLQPAGPAASEKRMVPDDQALTAADLFFAIERDGTGRGVGSAEEVIWKYRNRPGGIWGKEAVSTEVKRL